MKLFKIGKIHKNLDMTVVEMVTEEMILKELYNEYKDKIIEDDFDE